MDWFLNTLGFLALLFLFGSIIISVAVHAFVVVAPLFANTPIQRDDSIYVKVSRKAYDYDED